MNNCRISFILTALFPRMHVNIDKSNLKITYEIRIRLLSDRTAHLKLHCVTNVSESRIMQPCILKDTSLTLVSLSHGKVQPNEKMDAWIKSNRNCKFHIS